MLVNFAKIFFMNTKELIFAKSIELFALKSYNGTSIRNICKEVGIKESSFYNHYESKNKLLESIFDFFNKQLQTTEINDFDIDQITQKYTLRELLIFALNKNIEIWNNIQTNQIWFIVNTEQYNNILAARIIIEEDERRVNLATNLFSHLQEKQKMKLTNPKILAYMYIYAIKSLHYDYSIRKLHNFECEHIVSYMFQICNLFCDQWEIVN